MIALALLLALALDEKKSVEVTCPLDGAKFAAWEVTSGDYVRAWGGLDRDLCRHAFKTTPLELMVWACPSCGFAGTKADFDPKNALGAADKAKLDGKLKPAVALRKGMKQDEIPGHAKFDLMAQVALLRGAAPERAALAYLSAAWCERQRGAVGLGDFEEWQDVRRDFALDTPPLELGTKNRSDHELEIASRIEKRVAEGREAETRDAAAVKEAEARLAELTKDAAANAEAIRLEERRRGEARGRLHRAGLLKYAALWCWRRHGENVEAQRWIDELRRAKGDNSVIDDAVETAARTIETEASYLRKALVEYDRALAGGALAKAREAEALYISAELCRRLGQRAEAAGRYRKAAAATPDETLRRWAEEQVKRVE